jgi:hypothetical protein
MWLLDSEIIPRRIDRGGDAIKFYASKICGNINWKVIGAYIVVLSLTPVWVPIYFIGRIAEWRDDRKDGIKSVKE